MNNWKIIHILVLFLSISLTKAEDICELPGVKSQTEPLQNVADQIAGCQKAWATDFSKHTACAENIISSSIGSGLDDSDFFASAAKFIGTEMGGLVASGNPAVLILMRYFEIETTADKLHKLVQQYGEHAPVVITLLNKLRTDPDFRKEVLLTITQTIGTLIQTVVPNSASLTCDEMLNTTCQFAGMAGYEASSGLIITALTAGTAGPVVLGAKVAKYLKKFPELAQLTQRMATKLKVLTAQAKIEEKYGAISRQMIAKVDEAHPGPPKQNAKSLDELYAQAKVAQKNLEEALQAVAKESGGEAVIPEIKSHTKATVKINAKYDGDISRITDVSRGTLVYEDVSQVYAAVEKISSRSGLKIININDRFQKPNPQGYRDLQLLIEGTNGHISEVQIHVRAMQNVREKTHEPYDAVIGLQRQVTALGDSNPSQSRVLQDRIQVTLDELNHIHGEALLNATKNLK